MFGTHQLKKNLEKGVHIHMKEQVDKNIRHLGFATGDLVVVKLYLLQVIWLWLSCNHTGNTHWL